MALAIPHIKVPLSTNGILICAYEDLDCHSHFSELPQRFKSSVGTLARSATISFTKDGALLVRYKFHR